MNWYAILTKPKQEDRVADNLARAFTSVYNPKLKKKKTVGSGWRFVVEPLFPRYIFVKFEPLVHYHMVKYTRGVAGIVGAKGEPWPVDDEIVDFLRQQENEDGYLTIRSDVSVGDQVIVSEGPLKGLSGIFERETKGSERVVVLLNTIHFQASVEIEREFLKGV